MTERNVVSIREGISLAPLGGEPDPAVVERLLDLLEKARAGEITGIAYATLHPGDVSTYDNAGRATRGLLGALLLLQFEMCKADAEK
jgi:hypothetical protein